MRKTDYDAVVVGAGPNGLAAAICLQQAGLSVLVLEGNALPGGGLRSAALTLPGFVHDTCSAVHPMALASPFFKGLPLHDHGLAFIIPAVQAAHPFDDGTAAVLFQSMEQTVTTLGKDAGKYQRLMQLLLDNWDDIIPDILSPLVRIPAHPMKMLRFGWHAMRSAKTLSGKFRERQTKGLIAGMAAHGVQPLENVASASFGLVLMAAAHANGWPVIKGGSGKLATALESYFLSLGGRIETNVLVRSVKQLPAARAILFDTTAKQLLQMEGIQFPGYYSRPLHKFKYGMGVFKIDWALSEPIPFTNTPCRSAGTVHIGNSFEEIAEAERLTSGGTHPARPFVILAQPTLTDPSRSPADKHIAWAYCHVPNGSTMDMTNGIENQVERFAPGFKDIILARHTMNTQQLEAYNPNYIGGDIGAGRMNFMQMLARPVLSVKPYNTPVKGIYLCSASTPPGGGVHGMCGYHAAQAVLNDLKKGNI